MNNFEFLIFDFILCIWLFSMSFICLYILKCFDRINNDINDIYDTLFDISKKVMKNVGGDDNE